LEKSCWRSFITSLPRIIACPPADRAGSYRLKPQVRA
jgi:hypothetical protein